MSRMQKPSSTRRGPVALASALVLLMSAAAAARGAAAQHATDPFMEYSFRTVSPETVFDAGSFGGVQHFSLPLNQGSCPPSAAHGFAKCLLLPDGSQLWRVIVAWARVRLTRMANVAEDLSSFGPYLCDPPSFYMQPVDDNSSGSSTAPDNIPLEIHEHGGLAFFPVALQARIATAAAAPAYALRVDGSDYLAVLDGASCTPPADLLSVDHCTLSGGCDDGSGGGSLAAAAGAYASADQGTGGPRLLAHLQPPPPLDDSECGDDTADGSSNGSNGGSGGGSDINDSSGSDGDIGSSGGSGSEGGSSAQRSLKGGRSSKCSKSSSSRRQRAPALQLGWGPRFAPGRVPPTNWVLLSVPPTWNDDLRSHVIRLREHLDWHQNLGFTGHILYYDPAQISRLLRDPSFQQLLSSYRIILVRWSHFPRISWLPWDAQGLRLSHAYLALWGHDSGLLPIDVDEYLLLENTRQHPAAFMPPSSALRQLLVHCGSGAQAVTFQRFALFCGSNTTCPGGDELRLWGATKRAARGAGRDGGESATAGGVVLGRGAIGERHVRGIRGSDDGSSSSSSSSKRSSPLAVYDMIEAIPHEGSKAWSTVACTYPASVHEHRLSGLPGCSHVGALPSCGKLLHLINAFHNRAPRDEAGRQLLPFSHPWWPAKGRGAEMDHGTAAANVAQQQGPQGQHVT